MHALYPSPIHFRALAADAFWHSHVALHVDLQPVALAHGAQVLELAHAPPADSHAAHLCVAHRLLAAATCLPVVAPEVAERVRVPAAAFRPLASVCGRPRRQPAVGEVTHVELEAQRACHGPVAPVLALAIRAGAFVLRQTGHLTVVQRVSLSLRVHQLSVFQRRQGVIVASPIIDLHQRRQGVIVASLTQPELTSPPARCVERPFAPLRPARSRVERSTRAQTVPLSSLFIVIPVCLCIRPLFSPADGGAHTVRSASVSCVEGAGE